MAKFRQDFITNSSSSSFIITNKTDKNLTLVDFVQENPELIKDFINQYDWYVDSAGYTQEGLLQSAEDNNETIPANSSQEYIFGDEDGTIIGMVFDYILRDGGSSKSFSWDFHKYYR